MCPIKKKKKTKVKRPAARSAERALVPDAVPREDQRQVRRRRVTQSTGGKLDGEEQTRCRKAEALEETESWNRGKGPEPVAVSPVTFTHTLTTRDSVRAGPPPSCTAMSAQVRTG